MNWLDRVCFYSWVFDGAPFHLESNRVSIFRNFSVRFGVSSECETDRDLREAWIRRDEEIQNRDLSDEGNGGE